LTILKQSQQDGICTHISGKEGDNPQSVVPKGQVGDKGDFYGILLIKLPAVVGKGGNYTHAYFCIAVSDNPLYLVIPER
jgi:hypothetical protein